MSPLLAYHATIRAHRDGIMRKGLLRNEPTVSQIFGVYVFREDTGLDHGTYAKMGGGRCRWTHLHHYSESDLWRVTYIGPMCHDPYVENGMVLLADVPPNCVTLVTGNN